jgi:hypothetical protein
MLVCTEHAEDLVDLKMRLSIFVVTMFALANGHIWYYFDCSSSRRLNDHRSYGSDESMWDHLKQNLGPITDCILPSLEVPGTEAGTLSHFQIEQVDF